MAYYNTRERNNNWKGGRSIASNGYVLIRVGRDHHLSDVRGYAYEHRLVAERKIGRRLDKGEQVHHKNGDKQDNRPENLEIMKSIARHRLAHRKLESRRRLPGENNLMIFCGCGCGNSMWLYDDSGRSRRFINGHNPTSSPTRDAIRSVIGERMHRSEISKRTGIKMRSIATALSKMVKDGEIQRKGRGFYGS